MLDDPAVNVLVVSHFCVVETNQRIYGELERLLSRVDIVVPSRWFHQHNGRPVTPRRSSGFRGRILAPLC